MILFALLLAGADPAPGVTPAAVDKVKCKYQPVIGTVAQTVKECHTIAEWDILRRTNQDEARRVLNSTVSSRSN